MKKVWVLPATNTLCKMHAIAPYRQPKIQNLTGNYQFALDEDVYEKLIEHGADMNDPESIHAVLVKLTKGV